MAMRFGTRTSLSRAAPAVGLLKVGPDPPVALITAEKENGGLTNAFWSAMPTSVRSK